MGNPCDITTGNKFQSVVDYESPGPHTLTFGRAYNSAAPAAFGVRRTSHGMNWRHIFERRLHLVSPTRVSAERADGRVLDFSLVNGAWVPDADVDLALTEAGGTWTLRDADDSTEIYTTLSAAEAALSEIVARNGYRQSLSYDATGALSSVTDSHGRALSFTYANGLLDTLTTPDGLVVTYGYDASGTTPGSLDRLTSVTYSTTPPTMVTYHYEQPAWPFALTGITDETGQRFATWAYDTAGRATLSEHAGGADRTTIAYNSDGSRTVTNALGQQTVYRFATLQGVPKVTQIERLPSATTTAATRNITYDANGYVAATTDWNGTSTTFVNDARGLPTSVTEAAGTSEARTRTTTYDPNFHLPTRIVAPGVTTEFTYDPSGNLLTKTEIDTTTSTVPYATTGARRTWTYTWVGGLLASERGPRTDVTATTLFGYTNGALSRVTNALGHVTQVTAQTPGGRPLTIVDPNGVTTDLAYDARQRLVTETVHTADGDVTTRYAYDGVGNLVTTTLPNGAVTTATYDAARRLVGLQDALGQRLTWSVDPLGNRTTADVLDASGAITRTARASFDALGRRLEATGGANQVRRFAYDANGNALTVTDPLGRPTQQVFDQLNRLTTVTDPANGISATSYDAFDRPLSVTAPNGAVTTYVYDGFGQLLQTVSPDAGRTVYRYDAAGNVVRKTDATGAVTRYTYDALDRLRTVRYPAAPADDVTYVYDQTAQPFGLGRLTTVHDAVGRLQRTYDERGFVRREVRTRGTATLITAYRYDLAGRLTRIRYPSGARVLYGRDALGQVSDVTLRQPNAPSRVVASGLAYLPFGPLRALTYGNGVAETRTFDQDYRLTSIASAGAQPVQQLTYAYDDADNVLSLLDGVDPAQSQTFGYDALDHLASAVGSYGSQAWTYDGVGNRLTQQVGTTLTTYAYAAQTNRLTRLQTGTARQVVTYTRAGNIAQFENRPAGAPNTSLVYNEGGRLAEVRAGATAIQSYVYDGFGQRLVKAAAPLGTSLYQYDLAGHLLEDADSQGQGRVDYIYVDDRPIATLQVFTNALSFLHTDRLKTPQLATSATQAPVWRGTYEPFGAARVSGSSIAQSLRFPGQEFEPETGWHHNGWRDYLPGLGRYAQADPIGLRGGNNAYAYVAGNPLRSVDRSGLAADTGQLDVFYGARADELSRCDARGGGPRCDPLLAQAEQSQRNAAFYAKFLGRTENGGGGGLDVLGDLIGLAGQALQTGQQATEFCAEWLTKQLVDWMNPDPDRARAQTAPRGGTRPQR